MSINATLLGEFILLIMLVIGGISFYLGKRKTTIPIFVAALVFKKIFKTSAENGSS